jgi:hypothetical protein
MEQIKDLGRQIVEVFTMNKKISLVIFALGFIAGAIVF